MLVVRFKETFRERMPEWIESVGMLGWGMLVLASTNLFATQEFYHPLLNIMSQDAWGITSILVGALRLIFLVINGAWRPSAHIRSLGCGMGVMLWSTLLLSSLSLGWLAPASAIYTMLLVLDLISLWFAAGDAKLADLSAKGKIKGI